MCLAKYLLRLQGGNSVEVKIAVGTALAYQVHGVMLRVNRPSLQA